MSGLEFKNYRATFVDSEKREINVDFKTNAPRHDLVIESAFSEIKRQKGLNPKDISNLQVSALEVW